MVHSAEAADELGSCGQLACWDKKYGQMGVQKREQWLSCVGKCILMVPKRL